MKKIVLTVVAVVLAVAANAQKQYNYASSSKFGDNWSIGVQAGTSEKFTSMKHFNPTLVISADKYFTPWFGIGADARLTFDTKTTWKHQNPCCCNDDVLNHYTVAGGEGVSGYAKFNLTNLFLGYNGGRRMFEPVVYTGLGWQHINKSSNGISDSHNQMTYRAGVELNFNLGKKRAWALQVNPSVVFGGIQNGKLRRQNGAYEMTAGFVYHFKTSNGTHDFKKAVLRSQAEVDSLNSIIAQIKAENEDNLASVAELNKKVSELEARGPKIVTQTVTNTVTNTKENLECYVYYAQGKTVIAPSQLPNVERIATFLKNHSGSKVIIKGFASPEGSAEINQKIANARAEAVKTTLINKYKIDAERIQAEGQGVGNSFSEPDWNRVSICTIMQ